MTINEQARLASVLVGYRNKLNEYGQYIYDMAQDIDYLIREINEMPSSTYTMEKEVSDYGPSYYGSVIDDELDDHELPKREGADR